MRAVHVSHCDDDPHEGQTTEDNRRSQGCPAQSERLPECVVAAALGVWSGVWHRVHFDHRHLTRRRRRCHAPTHIPDGHDDTDDRASQKGHAAAAPRHRQAI